MDAVEQSGCQPPPRPGGRFGAALHLGVAVLLAVALALLLNLLAVRIGLARESGFAVARPLAPRTLQTLAKAQGPLQVTCYFERRHPLFAPTARLLRGLRAAASSSKGPRLELRVVDPRRDLVEAQALAARDVPPDALVFEAGGRSLVVPAAELAGTNRSGRLIFQGESVCAAAIARLATPDQPVVYWLTGHGEGDAGDYDPQLGFSAIGREIRHEGYALRPLRLWQSHGVPADAAALVVAAPHSSLAADEVAWLDDYLVHGGRLLYLSDTARSSGLEPLLERWGVRVTAWTAVSRETLSGRDTVILDYANHAITREFAHAATVFLSCRCIQPATADAAGADRVHVTPLVVTGPEGWGTRTPSAASRVFDAREDLPGPVTLAVAVERGGEAAKDIAMQPTRLAVFGEAAFVGNALLGARSSANRDLFINALNWLCGLDRPGAVSGEGETALWTGLDRHGWIVFTLCASVAAPACVLGVGLVMVARRRRART